MNDCLFVHTTTSTRPEADRLGQALVQRRLAACVQIVGPIASTYRWQGKVEQGQEWLCLIKTTAARLDELEQVLRQLHSYEMPELVAVPILGGSAAYLAWLQAQTAPDEA